MAELEFPEAWIRIDEAAVALNTLESRTYGYATRDGWRWTRDDRGRRVYAIEDVRATAKTEIERAARARPAPPAPEPIVHHHRGVDLFLAKLRRPRRTS